jgi:signal transduction histidine kinase/CheY-like chemotaxis protein/HPt (histidine-containing phosphotransfer) domain-containing protein
VPCIVTHQKHPTVHHFLVIFDHLGKRTIALEADTYSIGRDSRSSILVSSLAMSRHHATLVKVKDAHNAAVFRLIDGTLEGQRSTNGISVNDQPCHSYDLQDGDRITFGTQIQARYFSAVSLEALHVSNPQIASAISTPPNAVEELNRRDRLLKEVIAARELHFPKRLQKLLKMGCEWFDLEEGIFCEWSGDSPSILAQETLYASGEEDLGDLTHSDAFLALCALTAKHDQPIDYEHLGFYDDFCSTEESSQDNLSFKAWLSMQVIVGKQVHGLVCFGSKASAPRIFQPFQKDLLRFMAQWVGSEMERQQYQNALQKQLKQTVLLKQITHKIRGSLEPQFIFQTTVDQVGKTFRANRCVLMTYHEQPTPQLCCAAEYLTDGEFSMIRIDVPILGNPHALTVLSKDTAVASSDIKEDTTLLEPIQKLFEALNIQSMLAVRTSYQGKPNGVLAIHQCDRPRQWQPDEIELFEAVAAQVGIALAQAQLLAQETAHRQLLVQQNHSLTEATHAAEAASQAKSEFLAMMSHEIRTPMNAVIGTLDLIQTTPLNPQQGKYFSIIRSGSETLLNLLDDILDVSKIEAGKLQVEHLSFDLHACIDSVIELLNPKRAQKGLAFKYFIEPDVPQHIKGDRLRLQQILTNLMSNAIKFTEAGQISLRVIAYQPDPASPRHELQFMIQDTGIGISAQQQTNLFQAFSQVDTSITRRYGGTGLGLTISQQLVHLMGGRLWVESMGSVAGDPPPSQWVSLSNAATLRQDASPSLEPDFGRGAAFYFTITTTAADSPASAPRLAQPIEIAPGSKLSAGRKIPVLLVEDNPVNQTVAQFMLEQLGYEFRIANNGAEAIEALRKTEYALVLMDIEMPIMDGISAAQVIRAEWQTPHRPYIIALTAYAMAGDRERCINAGMQDYITKPLRMQDLQTALQRGENSLSLDIEQDLLKREPPRLPQEAFMILDQSILGGFLQMAGPEMAAALLHELVEAYTEDVPQRLVAIETAIAQSDPEALRQAAHALRSGSINLGAVQVGQLCRELEQMGKSGSTTGAQALYQQLPLAVGQTIGALESTYQNLQLAAV